MTYDINISPRESAQSILSKKLIHAAIHGTLNDVEPELLTVENLTHINNRGQSPLIMGARNRNLDQFPKECFTLKILEQEGESFNGKIEKQNIFQEAAESGAFDQIPQEIRKIISIYKHESVLTEIMVLQPDVIPDEIVDEIMKIHSFRGNPLQIAFESSLDLSMLSQGFFTTEYLTENLKYLEKLTSRPLKDLVATVARFPEDFPPIKKSKFPYIYQAMNLHKGIQKAQSRIEEGINSIPETSNNI